MIDDRNHVFSDLFTTRNTIYIIIAVGLFVYFLSFFNGFVGDDAGQIVNNLATHSVANIPKLFFGGTFYNGDIHNASSLYYRPLMATIFTIIYSLFAATPFWYHLLQLCLHICNAIFVFFILKSFFDRHMSLLLALLFLVHPMNVEAVAYASDLQDVLFFFFGAWAFYFSIRMVGSSRKWVYIYFLLVLSLLSKEVGILFVAMIGIYVILYQRQFVKHWVLTSMATLGSYAFLRIGLAHQIALASVQTYSPITQAPLYVRLLNIPSIFIYYLKTAFLPLHPAISQQWLVTKATTSSFYLPATVALLVLGCFILFGYHIFQKHSRFFTPYLFFLSWLLAGILFHLQMVFVLDATVADRWFYFPMLGLLGMIATIVQYVMESSSSKQRIYAVLVGVAFIVLFGFAIRSVVRITNFHDNYSFASSDINYAGGSSLLEGVLAKELVERGRYHQAELHALRAVQLDSKGAQEWDVLAVVYDRSGEVQKAKDAYIRSLKNGVNFETVQNYALFLLINDNLQYTEGYLHRALQLYPTDGYLWQLYALLENVLGRDSQAVDAAAKAVQYDPNDLTKTIYAQLSQGLPLQVSYKVIGKGKGLVVCPPMCNE